MSKMMRRAVPWLLLMVLLIGVTPRKAEAAVRLNKSSATIGIYQTITLKVTGTNAKVKWKSSNKKVATVSSRGVVTGRKKGTATITAKVKGKKYKCRVTVIQRVTKIKLNRFAVVMKKGGSMGLKATVSPWNADNKSVTWRSSNPKVVTVNKYGAVKAVGKGNATITATARDGSWKKAFCRVTVRQPVTGLRMNRACASIKRGGSISLGAVVSPWDASNKSVTWRSSNTRVATVDSRGTVRAVGKGTASITATAKDGSGKRSSCTITVTQPVTGISLNRTSASMKTGNTLSLSASVSPLSANNRGLTWKSSNTSVVTVNSTGQVKAVGRGTATITAVANDGSGKKAACSITVVQPVTGISLNKTSVSMKTGESLLLSAAVSPSNANNRNVTWRSSDANVATVNINGSVKAVGEGTATIIATANDGSGKNSACHITVAEPAPIISQEPQKPTELEETEETGTDKTGNTETTEVPEPTGSTETTEVPEPTGSTETTEVPEPTENPVEDTPESPLGADDGHPSEESDTEPVVSAGDTETTELSHTHTWIDVTKTVHHDEKSHTEMKQVGTKTVVDQEAWDEDVKRSVAVCKKCGYVSENAGDVANHIANEHDCEASYTVKTIKTTKHHDAVTHEEPIYENVKVVDEEAWDETVVTGQKCSECNATR